MLNRLKRNDNVRRNCPGNGIFSALPCLASNPYFSRTCVQAAAEMSTPTTCAAPALCSAAVPYPSPQAISKTRFPFTKREANAYLYMCSQNVALPARSGTMRSPRLSSRTGDIVLLIFRLPSLRALPNERQRRREFGSDDPAIFKSGKDEMRPGVGTIFGLNHKIRRALVHVAMIARGKPCRLLVKRSTITGIVKTQ